MMKDKTKEISSEKTTNKFERRTYTKDKAFFGSSKDADTLVRIYYDEIYYFVVRQINDRDAAYDLTQEIFISMLRSIGSYREKLASFRTWLYRIAENKVIDFRRRSIRWTVSLDNIYDADTFVPYDEASHSSGHAFIDLTDYGDLLSNKQLLADIECYVSRSRTDIQQIFRLHIYGGQTFKEIALALQIPGIIGKIKILQAYRSDTRRSLMMNTTDMMTQIKYDSNTDLNDLKLSETRKEGRHTKYRQTWSHLSR